MTFCTFQLLSPVVQLYWVLKHGTYLAQRWEDEGGVNLYHLADEGRGFLVEVGVGMRTRGNQWCCAALGVPGRWRITRSACGYQPSRACGDAVDTESQNQDSLYCPS